MNLFNVSSFIRISSIYIAIFKYTMWISFLHQNPLTCDNGKDCHDGIKFTNMCICLLIVNTILL